MTALAIIPAFPTLLPALVQVLPTINLLIPSISFCSMQTFTRNWKASCKVEGSLISRSKRLLVLFRHCSVRSCTRSPNRARIWNQKFQTRLHDWKKKMKDCFKLCIFLNWSTFHWLILFKELKKVWNISNCKREHRLLKSGNLRFEKSKGSKG